MTIVLPFLKIFILSPEEFHTTHTCSPTEKNVLFDTTDWSVCRQHIENIKAVLGDKKLDYLVINHMEPDHGASLEEVLIRYPEAKIISTDKAFTMMKQFGFDNRRPRHRC